MGTNADCLTSLLHSFIKLAHENGVVHCHIVKRLCVPRISLSPSFFRLNFLVQFTSNHPVIRAVNGQPFPFTNAVSQCERFLLVHKTALFFAKIGVNRR